MPQYKLSNRPQWKSSVKRWCAGLKSGGLEDSTIVYKNSNVQSLGFSVADVTRLAANTFFHQSVGWSVCFLKCRFLSYLIEVTHFPMVSSAWTNLHLWRGSTNIKHMGKNKNKKSKKNKVIGFLLMNTISEYYNKVDNLFFQLLNG